MWFLYTIQKHCKILKNKYEIKLIVSGATDIWCILNLTQTIWLLLIIRIHEFILLPLSLRNHFTFSSIEFAITISFAILPTSFILVAVIPRVSSLSVLPSAHPFSNIQYTRGVLIFSYSIILILFIFTIIIAAIRIRLKTFSLFYTISILTYKNATIGLREFASSICPIIFKFTFKYWTIILSWPIYHYTPPTSLIIFECSIILTFSK